MTAQETAPKVSLGVPVYNGEKFLVELFDSVLGQSFKDFELIVSDNASTDSTESICRSYAEKDERVRYVRQHENQGALFNFETLLELSRGEFFMWAAADDYFPDSFGLERLVVAIEQGYDYAIPNFEILNNSTGAVQVGVMDSFMNVANASGFARASLQLNNLQVYSLFRLDVLKDFFHYIKASQGMRCFNEGLFVHAISCRAKGCFVAESRKVYRRHDANLSSTQSASHLMVDFTRYCSQSFKFFLLEKSLKQTEKLLCLSILSFRCCKYGMYLFTSGAWRLTSSVIKRPLFR